MSRRPVSGVPDGWHLSLSMGTVVWGSLEWGGTIPLYLIGRAEFVVTLRCPGGDVKGAVGYMRLEFRGQVWGVETHLAGTCIRGHGSGQGGDC